MKKSENFEKVEITTAAELRKWLQDHHGQSVSVWLITYKKSEGDKYVSRWEVLDELLCFGWIDGIRRKLDDKRTMQLISKRKVDHWTKTYKERAVKLIEGGKMQAPGFKSIEVSKSKGLWDFMDDVDQLIVPEDLAEGLSKQHGAMDFFTALNDSSKRFALRWLKLAKTAKTRKNRIQKLVDLSAGGEKLPGS